MQVVYIDVDSLRPDHVGAHGYEPPTTPNIDEFAADAVRFDTAYTANSPCMPSRAGTLSGRYGLNNGVETHGPLGQVLRGPHSWLDWDGDASEYRTLPELFFENYVHAAAVASFPRHPAKWFYHLWDEFHHPREPEGEGFQDPRAEVVADRALEVVDRNADEDFYLQVQFWDPHGQYHRTDGEVERFRDETPLPPYPTEEQLDRHAEWGTWRNPRDPVIQDTVDHGGYDGIESREALRECLAHYDAEIRYADEHVGRLLDDLRDRGVYDDALILLAADHGEEFGEHGVYREHANAYDPTQRIPLFVKPPGGADLDAREEVVTNVDIAPTVADYAGLDAPGAWQGRSLRPLVEGEDADWREGVVLDHGLYTAQRAYRTDRWKLVRTLHGGYWEGVTPEWQLYDLAADPWEQEDVAAANPEVVADLREEMAAWVDEHRGREEDALYEVAREGPSNYTPGDDYEEFPTL
ncbi:MAG: sulfatase [Halobacteriaceae archaeon]